MCGSGSGALGMGNGDIIKEFHGSRRGTLVPPPSPRSWSADSNRPGEGREVVLVGPGGDQVRDRLQVGKMGWIRSLIVGRTVRLVSLLLILRSDHLTRPRSRRLQRSRSRRQRRFSPHRLDGLRLELAGCCGCATSSKRPNQVECLANTGYLD